MKLSIKTVTLQEMVSKAIKGASQNKLLALTSLMSIQLKNGTLKLITTDMSNYLYIIQNNVAGEDFYVTVQVDQFSKLISKMTSENITLELDKFMLTVVGNGTYKIELPVDENGNIIKYPDPIERLEPSGSITEINLASIKTVLTANKAALASTMEIPVYTNYYVGDRVVTTDTYKICGLNTKLFNEPILLKPETMNLLDVMTEEKITVIIEDSIILFKTNNCIVYGHTAENIDEFAIDDISTLLDEQFESTCKIKKSAILSVLDRIGLFVDSYDDNAITLTFTQDGIDISSKKSNGVETLPYVESKSFKAYTCQINITLLQQQIQANSADTIELQYGNDHSIKLVDGNIIQVVALLDQE